MNRFYTTAPTSSSETIMQQCISCNLCVKECAFLQAYGTPGDICRRIGNGKDSAAMETFRCNLCGLCRTLCPKDLDCAAAFLELRRNSQDRQTPGSSSPSILPAHRRSCRYEDLGSSSVFSLHLIPEDCHSVFFPGCALPATKAETTFATYEYLRTHINNLGVVLDCCMKPSHDLGLDQRFDARFSELISRLEDSGAKRIITACPSCYVTFREYAPQMETISVYEILAANPPKQAIRLLEEITIHDACATRFVPAIHQAVRSLGAGIAESLAEMPHSGVRTICCGEGGSASAVAPQIARSWQTLREKEAAGRRVITYCAGCSQAFRGKIGASHLLDLLFAPEKAILYSEKCATTPLTYFHRLLLKYRFLKSTAAGDCFAGAKTRL